MHPRTAHLVVIATLLFIVLGVWTVSALAWQTETVDSGGYGEYSSMALNVAREPRVSYYDRAHGDLRFAKNNYDGGGWRIETVDSAGDVGLYGSLVLNSVGNPCISYYDYTNGALKYAAYSGSAWTTQTVDSAGDTGLYSSLTLNSAGEPCISYYDQTNGDLKYAMHSASGWTIQTVDAAGDMGQYSSLARDNADEPCISYFDATNYRLKYAAYNGAAWQVQTVDAAGFAGMYSSLALDMYGRPRISCYDMANADLLYAAYNGLAWQVQTADSTGAVGKYSSLRLDSSGNPRIGYYDDTNQDLKYATLNGSAWQVETVDSAGAVGQYTSLVLDNAGNPQISYYYSTAGALKVAHPPLPAPTVTSINPTVGVLGYTIVADITGTNFHPGTTVRLVKTGYPDIMGSNIAITSPTTITCTFVINALEPCDYRDVVVTNADGQSGRIIDGFAVIRQGTGGLNWAVETVDSAGDVGWSTSIKLDSYNRPRISYLDNTAKLLKYAVYNGSGWQITTVDQPGDVWKGTSLALDSAGNPRISYQDAGTGTLKYARYAQSSWTISAVAPDGEIGGYSSLVLDPKTGNPRISYRDDTSNVLKYASYNGSVWQIQSLGMAGYDTSLALDSRGWPHISYEDAAGQLRYASWTGSAWTAQVVDSTAGSSTSLVLDSSGNPRISYGDIVRGYLKYAEFDGQAWHISTIDTGWVGLSTSLALDSDGHPHIAYTGYQDTALKYAEYNGSAWNLQTVDVAGNNGYDVSIALDRSNNVYISYRYMERFWPNDGDLRFAKGTRIGAMPVPATPSATPAPSGSAQPVETGTLYAASIPTGATILIDGTDRGYTNTLVTNVTPGVRNLTLAKDGYQPYTTLVNVPAKDVKVLAPITLTKGGGPQPPNGSGSLYVASVPSNANILINGTSYGMTDKLVTNVPSGIRNLTLGKEGYKPYTVIVDVPAGGTKVLAPITLTRGSGPVPPNGNATLYVASYPPGATISIDGTVRGVTNGFVYGVTAGFHDLALAKAGYSTTTTRIDVPSQGIEVLSPISLTRTLPGEIENIQDAIDATPEGGTLVLEAGTYYGNIVIQKSLTLIGAGSGLTILNGDTGIHPNEGGVINISKPFPHAVYVPNVTLVAMTITGGTANYGGGIFNGGGNLSLSQVSVMNNTAPSAGGIYNQVGTVIMNESSVSGNTAKSGGGVENDEGTFIMNAGSSISGNIAGLVGGGIANIQGTIITNEGSSISNNSAAHDGGGIYSYFYSTITLNGGSITGNTAENGTGGGIYIDSTSTVNQVSGTVSGNHPDDISYEFGVTYLGAPAGTISIDTQTWSYVVNLSGLAPGMEYWVAGEGLPDIFASGTTDANGDLHLQGVLNPAPNLRGEYFPFYAGTGPTPPTAGLVTLDGKECSGGVTSTDLFGTLKEDGAPLSGKKVEFYTYDPYTLDINYPSFSSDTTDSDGNFCKVFFGGHLGENVACEYDGTWDMNMEKASKCPVCS